MMKIFLVLLLAWSGSVVFGNFTQGTLTTAITNVQCQDSIISDMYGDGIYIYTNVSCGYHGCEGWYINSLPGGRRQMTTFDNLPRYCRDSLRFDWNDFVVALKEEHPDISTIDENEQTLSACAVNDTDMECLFDVEVKVKKCDNELSYYLPYTTVDYYHWGTLYCFERIYNDPCAEPLVNVSYRYISEEFVITDYSYYNGWNNYIVDGQQYVIPSIEDLQYLDWENSEFYDEIYYYYLAAIEGDRNYWMQLGEGAERLNACGIYLHSGVIDNLNFTCLHYFLDIYASKCEDGIRYNHDEYYYGPKLLVNANMNKPIVQPEIRHDPSTALVNGALQSVYKPSLQFRCSFTINETDEYVVNWYLNEELAVTKGPSNNPEELLFDETDLESKSLGFNIKCGYRLSEGTNETMSKNYFAGLKILDSDVKLSKRESVSVRVKLTVPMGCLHLAFGEETQCMLPLILFDPEINNTECAGGLSITDRYGEKCSEEIKTLKRGETWDPHATYRFIVTTVEHTYDDKTDFNLRFVVPNSASHTIWQGYQQDGVKVTVTENTTSSDHWHWSTYYRNKICYSRGDPHMKTVDGRWYPQQKEGDYMLYLNTKYQIEVQESTKFCFGDSGPVCECGIAVKAGQDVFMLDRCGDVNYLDFPQCGDGGILDVDVVNDYQYTITTPIGTKIIIYAWGSFMSTDIIMSAKDYGRTGGLCGYFDNNWGNDYLLSDGNTTQNHEHFAESWRLSDEINLFNNSDRELTKWSDNNSISCQCTSDGFCEVAQYTGCKKPSSITQTKCQLPEEKSKERSRIQGQVNTRRTQTIQKRSSGSEISNSTAYKICNESVYDTAAVKDLSSMLGDEDPNEVFKQCVFDVLASNDQNFGKLYSNAINNVAKNFIERNPVFVANNTDTVEKFLQNSCPGNCSGSGECMVTGQCNCNEFNRGPDCSLDIRIPPTILDIQGGGECDRASGDLCECFVVRTDHVFRGFKFELTTTRIHFDGKREQTANEVHTGNHEDIFTGSVCVPKARKRRDIQPISDYVLSYDVALSNDGKSYGTAKSIVVYDSTCHDIIISDGSIVVHLKDGFCYITGTCIPDGSTDGCRMCNAKDLPFEWSLANCENKSGNSMALLLGIIIGCTICGILVMAIIVYKICWRKQKNRVQTIPHQVTPLDGKGPSPSYDHQFGK